MAELTEFRHQIVGKFYNADFGLIPLTTVFSFTGHVTRLAWELLLAKEIARGVEVKTMVLANLRRTVASLSILGTVALFSPGPANGLVVFSDEFVGGVAAHWSIGTTDPTETPKVTEFLRRHNDGGEAVKQMHTGPRDSGRP